MCYNKFIIESSDDMASVGSFSKTASSTQVSNTTFSFNTKVDKFQGSAANADGRIVATDLMDFNLDNTEKILTPEKFAAAVGIIPVSAAKSILSGVGNFLADVGATAAVITTSVTSGVLDLGEHILDGAAWAVAGVGSLFGADTTGIREFIARDLVDEANEAFYENTDLGKMINEKSAVAYDSDVAQGIRHGTEKVAVFAAATAATVCTGGAASVALPLALGFASGAGKKAEETYQTKGTDIDIKSEMGIAVAGIGEAASWYAQGKLGEGATGLVEAVSENGLKSTGGAILSNVKSSILNIKDNGAINTLKGIFSKEQILGNLKKSLLQGDNISDSVGIIGDNVAEWINGDKEFNFSTAATAAGELIATWGLNVFFDSATDYVSALNDVSGIKIEAIDDAIKNITDTGDYVEETALFGESNEKKSFLARIFNGNNTPVTSSLSTQERILRDRINETIKQYGSASVTFNNTTEFTTDLLRNIDDLSALQVRINGGFNDLNGNFRAKYNSPKYIDRITYSGNEALAISQKLDELQSMINMNLPTLERANQIYEVLASEIPVMHDFESFADGHKVSASLRGLTDVNSVGKAGLVCAGYSQAYKELCTRCGITCDYIRGKAYADMLRQGRPGGHAWNVILDGNTPVPVDVTWRACGTTGWFGGSDEFVARHIADADEWFKDYSAPKSIADQIADALGKHDLKYGTGSGLQQLEHYLRDGDINHISSNQGARDVIRQMSNSDLQAFVIQARTNQTLDSVMDAMTGKFGYQNALTRMRSYITPGSQDYGNINVFTRTGDARSMMQGINFDLIKKYLEGRH